MSLYYMEAKKRFFGDNLNGNEGELEWRNGVLDLSAWRPSPTDSVALC